MNISKIHPFIRYAHYIPIDRNADYKPTIPYDHRFFYMYEGTAQIWTEEEQYILNKGDVLIIPSGNKYQLLTPQS